MAGNGLFITFEGAEGAGKSTQIKILAERLAGKGRIVRTTREPGGTPMAEKLREIVKHFQSGERVTAAAEIFLIEAARAQHVENFIKPALGRGEIVLCDRFFDSTTAYQGYGLGMDMDAVMKLNALAAAGCRPGLTLILDLPTAVGMARAGKRAGATARFDRFEERETAFFERVRAGFLAIAAAEPERVKIIEANAAQEAVAEQIAGVVNAFV